jgi:subtilase family serine protease
MAASVCRFHWVSISPAMSVLAMTMACSLLADCSSTVSRLAGGTNPPPGVGVGQIKHAYGFDQVNEDGAHQLIAIVEPFDDPSIEGDLVTFSQAFHLPLPAGALPNRPCTVRFGPHPCFVRISPTIAAPTTLAWAREAANSVEWSHALAPAADLMLVEAVSNQMNDLMSATRSAAAAGATVVVITWGMPEKPAFRQYDDVFTATGVAFVAASGDFGHGVNYPAASPRVIAVGGTEVDIDAKGVRTGNEIAWSGSGGGTSSTEPMPEYQRFLDAGPTGRMVPDVSIAASPVGGFASFSTGAGGAGWHQVIGTSVGAALWAALIALIDQRLGRAIDSPEAFYQAAKAGGYRPFENVPTGSNGGCGFECSARPGYDELTGLGTPNAVRLLDALMRVGSS